LTRRRGPDQKVSNLLGNLDERLVALGFLNHQLARHVSNGNTPEGELTVRMLVQEEGEKIVQLGELLSEVLSFLLTTSGDRPQRSYIS
jgi:hypothetical protein